MTRALLLLAAIVVVAGSAVGSYRLATAEPTVDRVAEPSTPRIDQPRSQRPLSIDLGAR